MDGPAWTRKGENINLAKVNWKTARRAKDFTHGGFGFESGEVMDSRVAYMNFAIDSADLFVVY